MFMLRVTWLYNLFFATPCMAILFIFFSILGNVIRALFPANTLIDVANEISKGIDIVSKAINRNGIWQP